MDTSVRQEKAEAAVNGFVPGLVSVVTPVYNGAEYLPRMLVSVLSQSYDSIEMILCDDGSTDDTPIIAKAFAERFRERGYSFRFIRGEHKNASAAINLGLSEVRGEFLIWPDSDDRLDHDSVKLRAEFLQSRPEYQCVRSLCSYEYADGSPAPRDERTGEPENERLFFPVLEGKTFVSCGCYMLRSAAFFAIYPERRIPEYDVGQNFQMLLPFMYAHPCPTIRRELYAVCVHEGSHSRRLLTEQQERKKYSDYENMIDELSAIAGITDRREKKRVRLWKLWRRAALARRHNRRLSLAKAYFDILLCLGPKEFIREALRRSGRGKSADGGK